MTARNAPAHKRVVNTLRAWGVRVDETFFLGGVEKAGFLEVLRPHIYFDDQEEHLQTAQQVAPSARVIAEAEQMTLPLVDSEATKPSALRPAQDGQPGADQAIPEIETAVEIDREVS